MQKQYILLSLLYHTGGQQNKGLCVGPFKKKKKLKNWGNGKNKINGTQ